VVQPAVISSAKADGAEKLLPNRLFFLDFIRALSVLMIILYHFDLQLLSQAPTAHTIPGLVIFHQAIGDLGVTLFVMISGVGLMTSSSKAFSAADFYKKRLLGIYPSFWIAYLAVGAVLFLIRGFWVGDDQHWKFALTLTGFDGLLLYRGTNYYLIGEWFIGFILLFYAMFPLLRRGVLNRPILTWIAALIVVFTLHRYYGRLFDLNENRNPLIRLPEFLFGLCFLRYVLPMGKKALVASIAALVVFAFWYPPIHIQFYGILLGIVAFCALAFSAELIELPPSITRFITWTAKYSFLAFLVHHQVIYVLLPRVNAAQLTTTEVYVLFGIVVAISFAAAVLLYRPVEKFTAVLRGALFARDGDPSMRSLASALAFCVGALGVAMFASAMYGVARFYSPIPWLDEWDGYIGFYRNITTGWTGGWWVNHMEHRIVTSRVLYWLDIKVFGGQHVFLFIIEQVMQASLIVVTWAAYRRGRNNAAPMAWLIGLPLALLFSWTQSETFKWGFETQVIAAYLFALLSALAFTGDSRRASRVTWALVFAALAELSMGNGLLAFPMLFALCIYCRRPAREYAAIAITWAVMWAIYFINYTKPPVTRPQLTLVETGKRFVEFFFAFMGNPSAALTGNLSVSMTLGAITFGLMAWLALAVYRSKAVTSYRAFLIGSYAFVVLSALAAMSGRAYFGPAAATASRYTTGPLLAWVMLGLLAFDFAKTEGARRLTILASAVAAALLATFQFHVTDDNSYLFDWKLAVLAHKIGLPRPELEALLFPAEAREHFSALATFAEKKHVALYGKTWLKDAGEIEFDPTMQDDSLCDGFIDAVQSDKVGPVVRGWLTTRTGQSNVLVVLVSTAGRTIGYGLTGMPRPDVASAISGAPKNAGWEGFATKTDGPIRAFGYLHGKFCALR
jgi:peptidoglycan/LPS O-acetylase OafA/YrhL